MHNKELIDKAKQLKLEGKGLREIGKILAVSYTTVRYWFGGYGKPRPQKATHEMSSWTHIRNKVFKDRGRKCEKCGWAEPNPFTGIIPVQVHHIDGDVVNNHSDNLQVLCPNCHSMTEHFMFYGKSHKDSYGQKGTKRFR